jgi:hypothetical protein
MPFIMDEPLDYESGRVALKTINSRRMDALRDLENATQELTEAERAYRKERARVIGDLDGTALEKQVKLDGDTADFRHRRDGAEWAVKIIQERLRELDGQRASLHRLVEWSSRFDPHAAEVFAQGKR